MRASRRGGLIDANELAWLPSDLAASPDRAATSLRALRVEIAPPSDSNRGAVLSIAGTF